MAKIKNISSIELRQKLNKLHAEMGFVDIKDVKTIISELEKESYEEYKKEENFCLSTLYP
jgi:hypothetical protein